MSEIKNLNPECIWKNFDALTQVPRPSGHLEKVQQFLLDFAARVGVEAFKDPADNIVMRKPATPGMEGKKGVILQAHMDMVPQKSPESTHNFETDPIETYIDGEWVKAKGMFGANALPADELHGDVLLNLDSECWGKFVIGSAGGINVTATLGYKEVDTDPDDAAVRVTLKGLRGGHSGLEINEGRANANKLMVRFVREAIADCEARLATWHGGNMRNAIPFQAVVVLTLPKENVEALKELVADWKADFEDEYKGIESGIEFFVEDVETPKTELPEEIQDNLVDAIYAVHDGVVRMIPAYPHVVETSSNLAIIDIEGGNALIKLLPRSAREDMKDYVVNMIASCLNMAGMKVETAGSYGGWDPNPESPILHHLLRIYKEQNGKDGIIQIDHAGLECSIILGKYPHLDVVSLGPTMMSPHTTGERALIPTVEPFWNLLKQALEEI